MKILLRKSGNDLNRDSELLELSTANVQLDFVCSVVHITTSYFNVELKNKM